jgi:transcriptional regulator with XRE-family HTH domain
MPRTSLTPDQAQQLGTLLRARRAALELSLRQVAQLTGLNISTLSEIETGVNLSPLPDTLKLLAGALGLSVSDVFVATNWLPADELPTLKPYLRAKYGDLDEQAITELEAYAIRLIDRHGGHGPVNREDEQP